MIEQPAPDLRRHLGLFDTTMFIVGIVIGSGIFLTTGILARFLPSVPLILLAWVVGGILTMAGALCFAELGASMPQAGGLYVYIREAYGRMAGFLFGWICFAVYETGTIAALAAGFAEFFVFLCPAFAGRVKLVSLSAIALLTALNYVGTGPGKWLQNLLSVAKIATLLGLIVLALTVGRSHAIDFSINPYGWSFSQLLVGFGIAQVAISWAFGGWNNLGHIAGEIRNPQRMLPLGLITGTSIVTGLYLLTNYVYLRALPLVEVVGTVRIAEKATAAILGGATAAVISVGAMLAILGSLNAVVFSGARIFYAMACDGLFFRRAACVHPRFRTPGFALLMQATWSAILTLSGSFEQLLTYTMFVALIFWIAGVLAVPVLRSKHPTRPRPYETWGYPIVPAVFVIATLCLMINTLVERPIEAMAGLFMLALGIPVYFYWSRGRSPSKGSGTDRVDTIAG